MYGNRLANTRVTLLAGISHACYGGAGILEHKAKMDSLRRKLTFFINSLPEEFDVLFNMVNYDLETVEEVLSNIH